MVLLGRIELPTAEYQSAIIPFNYRSRLARRHDQILVLLPSTALGTRGYKALVMLFNYRSMITYLVDIPFGNDPAYSNLISPRKA